MFQVSCVTYPLIFDLSYLKKKMFYIKINKVVELVVGGSIINRASASCYAKTIKKSAKHFSLSTFSTVALSDNLVTFEFVSA